MLKELEEQYINLLVSIYEGTAPDRQLKGFRQAMKIVLNDDQMDEVVNKATKRAERIIKNVEAMK